MEGEAAKGELNFSEVCRDFGVSRSPGYEWVGRYQDASQRSRRPHTSPTKVSDEVEDILVAARKHEAQRIFDSAFKELVCPPPFARTRTAIRIRRCGWIRLERIEPGKPQQNGRQSASANAGSRAGFLGGVAGCGVI